MSNLASSFLIARDLSTSLFSARRLLKNEMSGVWTDRDPITENGMQTPATHSRGFYTRGERRRRGKQLPVDLLALMRTLCTTVGKRPSLRPTNPLR